MNYNKCRILYIRLLFYYQIILIWKTQLLHAICILGGGGSNVNLDTIENDLLCYERNVMGTNVHELYRYKNKMSMSYDLQSLLRPSMNTLWIGADVVEPHPFL